MTRFIKNIDGFVHSVVDEFVLPAGWSEASEADASDALLGKGEPNRVEQPTVIAPAAITPSQKVAPGVADPRVLDAVPSRVNAAVFPDGKPETYPNGTDPVANATPVGEVAPQPADSTPDEGTVTA